VILAYAFPPFTTSCPLGYTEEETDWWRKVGMSKTLEKYEGSTISLHGCGASGAYASGPAEEQNRTTLFKYRCSGSLMCLLWICL